MNTQQIERVIDKVETTIELLKEQDTAKNAYALVHEIKGMLAIIIFAEILFSEQAEYMALEKKFADAREMVVKITGEFELY